MIAHDAKNIMYAASRLQELPAVHKGDLSDPALYVANPKILQINIEAVNAL